MSRFAIRYPYFIIVACLMTCVLGFTSVLGCRWICFPKSKYLSYWSLLFTEGMPPEQIEDDITGRSNVSLLWAAESTISNPVRLPGVGLIKIYFQPGTIPTAVTNISNLAMADLRRLPPGTLPPVVLKFDASSLPPALLR